MPTNAATPRVPPRPSTTISAVVSSSPGSGPAIAANTTIEATMTTVLPMGAAAGRAKTRLALSSAIARNPNA